MDRRTTGQVCVRGSRRQPLAAASRIRACVREEVVGRRGNDEISRADRTETGSRTLQCWPTCMWPNATVVHSADAGKA